MQKKKVIVLTTGGTIEKTYNELDGSLQNRHSDLPRSILSKLRLPGTDLVVSEIMAKDSLDMTLEDRELIFEKVLEASKAQCPILVLHGTDTMAQTANHCFEQKKDFTVPVIFTGAMKPVGFEDSDALQNFTESLILAQVLSPGLYVAFHSQLFKVPHVRKNKERGTFERK